jgi:hypothetical protein
MKRIPRPTQPTRSTTVAASNPLQALNRIKLALLEEYTDEKRGYDPYDTSRDRAPDIWASKRKRA